MTDVCDTDSDRNENNSYSSSIWVGYAASNKSSGHTADSKGVSCLRDACYTELKNTQGPLVALLSAFWDIGLGLLPRFFAR